MNNHRPPPPPMDSSAARRRLAWSRLLAPARYPPAPSPDADLDELDVLWSRHDAARTDDSEPEEEEEEKGEDPAPLPAASPSARAIPAGRRRGEEEMREVARSAPIPIPLATRARLWRRQDAVLEEEKEGEEYGGQWLPPHEIVARTWEKRNMTCYSVVEGAGRTLKGRDLRRVRNAVWQKTGFLD